MFTCDRDLYFGKCLSFVLNSKLGDFKGNIWVFICAQQSVKIFIYCSISAVKPLVVKCENSILEFNIIVIPGKCDFLTALQAFGVKSAKEFIDVGIPGDSKFAICQD